MATLDTNSAGASFSHPLYTPDNTDAGGYKTQQFSSLTAANYVSLYDLIERPDNRDLLVKTYGAQGITGFLQMVGAVKANGSASEVQYWEEERLHRKQKISGIDSGNGTKRVVLDCASGDLVVRNNDVVLTPSGKRALVVANDGVDAFTLVPLADANLDTFTTSDELVVIGNMYAEGTDQPTEWMQSGIVRRANKYNIVKDIYKVSGSQATNIGWVNVGGQNLWYIKSEADTRQRFMDKREMMMILGDDIALSTSVNGSEVDHALIDGGEGYFAAIEDRGIVASDLISSLSDVDDLVKVLDKEGGASEYAMYVNRAQDLRIDDILAQGIGSSVTTGAAAFGSFQNNKDAAIALGFVHSIVVDTASTSTTGNC